MNRFFVLTAYFACHNSSNLLAEKKKVDDIPALGSEESVPWGWGSQGSQRKIRASIR